MKFVGLLSITVIFLASCSQGRDPYLQDLLASEPQGEELADEEIAELRASIRELESELDRRLEISGNLGHFYRVLGKEFMDRRMFGPAMEAIDEALFYEPQNRILFYYMGVSAGQMAAAALDSAERTRLLERAEAAYLRAIEIDPGYVDARYGLSVLYVFEMERPRDAVVHLERGLEAQPNNVDLLFLRARVAVVEGRISEAVDLYDRIAEVSSDPEVVAAARENQRSLLGGSP